MPEKGTSILSKLTAEVMGEKVKESRKLTAVEGEAGFTDTIPNDVGVFMSNERLADHASDLRKFAAEAIVIADGLEMMVRGEKPPDPNRDRMEAEGGPEYFRLMNIPGKLKAAEAAKAKWLEEQADERIKAKTEESEPVDFNAAFKAKQEEAKAATFSEEFGWECPDHGKATNKTSGKGRQFVGCPDCNQFKR